MLLIALHITCNREAHGRLLSRGWCLSRLKERRAPYLEEWQLTNDGCAYVPYPCGMVHMHNAHTCTCSNTHGVCMYNLPLSLSVCECLSPSLSLFYFSPPLSFPSLPPFLPPISLCVFLNQASYWSSKKYEVHGDVYDSEGEKVRHLFGTWHEAMYCGQEGQVSCVWQAGEEGQASCVWQAGEEGQASCVWQVRRDRPPVCGRQVRRDRPPVCGRQVRRDRPPVCGR